MVHNAQQKLLFEEFRRHCDSAARRNDEAALELRAADEIGDWGRVLKTHQRKMRAGAQRELLAGAMDLVEADLPLQTVIFQLEDNLPRSRATVLALAHAANAKAASGRLTHDNQPPQLDQDWSNMSYALGQDLMLTHIVNFARYTADTSLNGQDEQVHSDTPAQNPWEEVNAVLSEEISGFARIDESLAEQQQYYHAQRRSSLQNNNDQLADQAYDSLNNLDGQRDAVTEMIRILGRAHTDSPSERCAAAMDLEELDAFAQVQQSAWEEVFTELIAARDVAQGESANKFLNHANGYMYLACRSASIAKSLRVTLE